MSTEEDELNNRFVYHPPSSDEVVRTHTYVREWCNKIARGFFWNLPNGREKSLAITKIEEAMFWANAAIARNQKEDV